MEQKILNLTHLPRICLRVYMSSAIQAHIYVSLYAWVYLFVCVDLSLYTSQCPLLLTFLRTRVFGILCAFSFYPHSDGGWNIRTQEWFSSLLVNPTCHQAVELSKWNVWIERWKIMTEAHKPMHVLFFLFSQPSCHTATQSNCSDELSEPLSEVVKWRILPDMFLKDRLTVGCCHGKWW